MSAIDATTPPGATPTVSLFRAGPVDAWLLLATGVQTLVVAGALLAAHRLGGLFAVPAALLVALGLWWNANTIAHIHLHRPVFRHRALNRALSVWLSVLLGFPQVLWRHRHLWHHAGEPANWPRLRWGRQGALELAALAVALATLALVAPWTLVWAWLPGYALGMALCQAQGHYEHHLRGAATAPGVSHYSRWYNRLWFNDGYHVEHHRAPSQHWSRLPALTAGHEPQSAWPPVLRWLEALARGGAWTGRLLVWLERIALRSRPMQRWLVRRHRHAFAQVWTALPQPPRRVLVVGGGLFPRTLAVLRELQPDAELLVMEADASHIAQAQAWLARHDPAARIRFECGYFDPGATAGLPVDLVVLPLAFVGDPALTRQRAQMPMLEHVWLWQRGGASSAVVSWALCKRVNLWLPGAA